MRVPPRHQRLSSRRDGLRWHSIQPYPARRRLKHHPKSMNNGSNSANRFRLHDDNERIMAIPKFLELY